MGGGNSKATAVPEPVLHAHIPGMDEEKFTEVGPGGRVVETFKVIKPLGAGAFGRVYLVERASDGQELALKIISTPDEKLDSVMKEAQTLKDLNHPHIVAFKHSFRVRGAVCLVLEHVEGNNLENILQCQREKLPLQLIMAWFLKILETLCYIHSKQCVHRDLKPGNLIANNEKLKVVDFGISVFVNADAKRTIVGTPLFMELTILHAARLGEVKVDLDPSYDMWALGAILYNCLTLEPLDVFRHALSGTLEEGFAAVKRIVENIDDPSGALKFLLLTMLCPKSERWSAKRLMESHEILAWRIALDPRKVMDPPTYRTQMMPLMAILHDNKTSTTLRSKVFERLTGFMKLNSAFTKVALEMKLIEGCMKHLDDKSIADQDLDILLPLFQILGSNDEAGLRALLQGGKSMRSHALQCLMASLRSPPISHIAANYIVAHVGVLEKLWDIFGNDSKLGRDAAQVVGLILLHRQAALVADAAFSAEFQLSRLKPSHPSFGVLYQRLGVREDAALLMNALGYMLSNEANHTVFLSVSEILKIGTRPWAKLCVTQSQQERIGEILEVMLRHCPSEKFSKLMQRLLNQTVPPMDNLVRSCAASGTCSRLIGYGIFRFEQPLLSCTTCANDRKPSFICIACAYTCHRGHAFENRYNRRNEFGSCHCTQASPTHSPEIKANPSLQFSPRVNQNLLPELNDEEKKTYGTECRYWPAKKELILSSSQTPTAFGSLGLQLEKGRDESLLFYFEVEFLEAKPTHENHAIGVGLSPKPWGNRPHMVGKDQAEEFGYHSNEGKLFAGEQEGRVYGFCYGQADVIGCGLRQNGAIFFTFNGCYLGDSPRAANSSKLYATVSALGMSLKCKFNFDGPFLFDSSLAVSQADIDQLYLTQAPIPFIRGLFSAIKTPKAPLVRAPKWDCNTCTFTNQPSRSTCEMCEHPCPPHVQAIKSSAAKRLCEGIMVGSEVMLSQGCIASDLKEGPLKPGQIGVVVQEDLSQLPFKVELKGGADAPSHWYKSASLVLHPQSEIWRSVPVVDWNFFFEHLIKIPDAQVALGVLWLLRIYDVKLYEAFSNQYQAVFRQIMSLRNPFVQVVQKASPNPPRKQVSVPRPQAFAASLAPASPLPTPLTPELEPSDTASFHFDSPSPVNPPSATMPKPNAEPPASYVSRQEFDALMRTLESKTFAFSRTRGRIFVFIRKNGDECTRQECSVEPLDTLTTFRARACHNLGISERDVQRITKVIEAQNLHLAVNTDDNLSAFREHDLIVLHTL